MVIPFGILFTVLGMSPFFSERVLLRFLGVFFLLLAIALLAVVQALQHGDGLPRSWPKPPLWYSGLLIVGWGSGIFFGFRCWRASRAKAPPDTQPLITD